MRCGVAMRLRAGAATDTMARPPPHPQVRSLFVAPEVTDPATIELKWGEPDEDGLRKFLVDEKGFNAARVDSGIAKLKKARTSGSQMRMDSFFKAAAPPTGFVHTGAGAGAITVAGVKRKLDDKGKGKSGGAKKKK